MPLSIAQQFDASARKLKNLGHGLINDTYLVHTDTRPFVLQRINSAVFKEPPLIMENLVKLNQHLYKKTAAKLQIPAALPTNEGAYFYQDARGDYWRALSFIDHSLSLEALRNINDAAQIGFALGHFHTLLSDLDPAQLHDTLPDFHISPRYLNQYQQTLAQKQDVPEDRYCADFIDAHGHIVDHLENAKQQHLLPLRVIHGDPKLNNFLFADNSPAVIGLVDLDTVKPGLVHYDLGDCLRSCCHQAGTDTFDLNVCTAILKSYVREAGGFFSAHDYDCLYAAIRLIPFELGLRFYTDHLQGNCYFKVEEAEQNLRRAQAQFRLCADIMAKEQAIKELITGLTC